MANPNNIPQENNLINLKGEAIRKNRKTGKAFAFLDGLNLAVIFSLFFKASSRFFFGTIGKAFFIPIAFIAYLGQTATLVKRMRLEGIKRSTVATFIVSLLSTLALAALSVAAIALVIGAYTAIPALLASIGLTISGVAVPTFLAIFTLNAAYNFGAGIYNLFRGLFADNVIASTQRYHQASEHAGNFFGASLGIGAIVLTMFIPGVAQTLLLTGAALGVAAGVVFMANALTGYFKADKPVLFTSVEDEMLANKASAEYSNHPGPKNSPKSHMLHAEGKTAHDARLKEEAAAELQRKSAKSTQRRVEDDLKSRAAQKQDIKSTQYQFSTATTSNKGVDKIYVEGEGPIDPQVAKAVAQSTGIDITDESKITHLNPSQKPSQSVSTLYGKQSVATSKVVDLGIQEETPEIKPVANMGSIR